MPSPIPWMSAGKNSSFKNVAFFNPMVLGGVQVEKTYIRYGDFEFDSVIDLKFQVEPVYDSAGVLPKYYKHTFTIETVLTPANYLQDNAATDEPVDPFASQLRRMLAIPGRRLWIYGKGVGQNQRMSQFLGTDDITVTDASVNQTGINNPPLGHPVNFPVKTSQDPTVDTASDTLELENTPNAENVFFFKVEEGMDLNYGPKPVVQILEAIGSSRAYRLNWSVEVCLPICCVRYLDVPGDPTKGRFCLTPGFFNSSDEASYSVTEFSYSYAWEIDEAGYASVTLSGSVEFAGRLFTDDYDGIGPGGLDISQDGIFYHTRGIDLTTVREILYNTFLTRLQVEGFIPSVTYNTSSDNKRLDFRITFKEVKGETPYFKGIANCSARTYVENSESENMYTWSFGISGNFTPFPGIPKDRALAAFVVLIKSRLRTLQSGGLTFANVNGQGNVEITNVQYMLQTVRFEEDIFTQRSSFSLVYRVVCDLAQILKAVEMWKPVVGNSTWVEWTNEIPQAVRNLQGRSDFYPDDFTGILESTRGKSGGRDLLGTCRNPYEFYRQNVPLPQKKNKPSYVVDPAQPIFSVTSCPPNPYSYRDYRVWFELEERKPTVMHYPAAKVAEAYYQDPNWTNNQLQSEYLWQSSLRGTTPSQLSAATVLGSRNDAYPTVQGMGAGSLVIRMKGYALRYCGQVNPPALVQVKAVGGNIVKPIQVSSNSMINRTVFYGTQKLIFGAWDIAYAVPVPLDAGSNFVDSLLTNIEGEAYVSRSLLKSLNPINPQMNYTGTA